MTTADPERSRRAGRSRKDPERRAELTEHLAELRARLIRCVVYLAAGTTAAWFLYDDIFRLLVDPMIGVLKGMDSKFLMTSFPEAFVIRLQICVLSGLIFTSPFVTMEIWGFIAPGLTPQERRPVKWVAPLSVVLFVSGVLLCYKIMPMGFRWFAGYVPAQYAELRPTVQGSLMFVLKMMLAFGIVFELPVFLMLLAKVGIVNSRMLLRNWRYAMVAASVVAAVATPSADAFSMMMMAVPVAVLYFASIALVRFIER